jgi:hypothetical protein
LTCARACVCPCVALLVVLSAAWTQSVVNDKIKQIDRNFDIKKTNFPRFSDLAKKVEEEGHMTLGRKKETLHVEECKYYDASAPVR